MAVSVGDGIAVGIDIGGTKTTMVVTDRTGRLLREETIRTEREGVAAQVVELVKHATSAFPEGHVVEGVGIAAPGHVDPVHGVVRLAVNLDGADIPLARVVGDATGLPCIVEHDARAAAAWLARRDGTRDLAYLSVGTGISAGLIIEGRLLRGADGLAGEIGHTVADPNGPICTCGLRGCLEAVAAGPAIAREARARSAIGSAGLVAGETARDVFEAAGHGDPVARGVIEEVAVYLARAIRALVLGFGVSRVVVGGGVAGAGQLLLAPLLAAIAQERSVSRLVDAAFSSTAIELLPPTTNAGARGAAALVRDALAAGHPTGASVPAAELPPARIETAR